jgi:serine/threonine protein kinase
MAELPHLDSFADVMLTAQRMARSNLGLVYIGPNLYDENHWCALKTVRPELLGAGPSVRERFVREALVWCGLWPHANLLTTRTVDTFTCDTRFSTRSEYASGQPFLVLEYSAGEPLRDLLTLPYDFATRLFWAQCIAAGLLALHTPDPDLLRPEPLAHGDLKPENVLIVEDGRAVLSTCSLAKALEGDAAALAVLDTFSAPPIQSGAEPPTPAAVVQEEATRCRAIHTPRGLTLGARAYLAPEHWQEVMPRTSPADLYAFGILLSELLAGRHALLDLEQPQSEEVWRQAHQSGLPRRLRQVTALVPASLENLYQALLAKHPEQRPTAHEALTTLRAAADQLGLERYDVSEVYPRTSEHQLERWHAWAMAYHYVDFDVEALACNQRALELAANQVGLLWWRAGYLGALAGQEEEKGQVEAQQAHIDELLTTLDALQAAIPANDVESLRNVWMQRTVYLWWGQRYAEADANLAQATAHGFTENDVSAQGADNQLRWGMAEAQAGRGHEALVHYQQGLELIARAMALSDDCSDYLEIQVKLQQAIAEEYNREGTEPPSSSGDPP